MNREIIIPRDEKHWHELRAMDITSTDIAALFNLSPYMTYYELWHRKKNQTVVEFEETEWVKWGKRLQGTIANGIAEDNKWTIRPMDEYIRIPSYRIGSSFDFAIGDDGILEVKNVFGIVFKNEWISQGGNIEAPPHIEIQAQHQLLTSGRKENYIGALISGNKIICFKREPDLAIHEAIKSKVAAFWESIDANREPTPDFKADADFITKLNQFAEPGKLLNAMGDAKLAGLVRDYKEWGDQAKAAQDEKDGIKAQILTLIQDAEKVVGDGYTISASLKPPTLVEAYTRKAFRDFRVFLKKEIKV